jgi:hypothetical protein
MRLIYIFHLNSKATKKALSINSLPKSIFYAHYDEKDEKSLMMMKRDDDISNINGK